MIIVRDFVVDMKEELFNRVFGKQRAAKDAHNLHDWSVELVVVLNDSHEAVCDDGHMYLDAYRILGLAPKGLDFEMLLDPFEKEFDLPSISVQKRDIFGRQVEVVGVVGKCALKFGSVVDNPSDFGRIVALVVLSRESDSLVSDDIVHAFEVVFAIDDFVFGMALLSDDKECSGKIDFEEPGKVKISPVKHIARKRLVCKPVHGVDIMHVGIGDPIEYRDLGDDVDLRMDFDAGLCRAKLSPFEDRHAQVDSRGINCVESPMKFKFFEDALLLGNPHHIEGKLLEDAIVSKRVCFGEHLPVDWQTSKSKEKRFVCMSSGDISKFSQASTTDQLTEHQYQQVVPMGECPPNCSIVVCVNQSFEVPLGKKSCDLRKNKVSNIHMRSNMLLDAKIHNSKVRQAFS